uniref:Uncharacterized protein n=1 Tax=Romanomermis culicivorax TaxID=13658 RepID=A0A915KW18_ROMCU
MTPLTLSRLARSIAAAAYGAHDRCVIPVFKTRIPSRAILIGLLSFHGLYKFCTLAKGNSFLFNQLTLKDPPKTREFIPGGRTQFIGEPLCDDSEHMRQKP